MQARQNLARLWEDSLDRLGDYPAVWFDGVWHHSGRLFERATAVSGGLRARGVGPGSRVVVVMANCPEVGITYHAVWRAGGVVTPAMFLLTADELRAIFLDAEPALVVTTADLLPKVQDATAGLDLPVAVVGTALFYGTPGNGGAGLLEYAELEAADAAPPVRGRDDDLAALLYTGGTTGRSKGVALTHAGLFHSARASRQVSHVNGLNRALQALPLAHAYGLLITIGAQHLPEPENTVLMRWFNAETWLQLAQEHAVEHTAIVPAMLAGLLAQPLEKFDLSALRHVYSGAASLPLHMVEQFERRVPGVQVLEGYGCTETGGIATSTRPGRRRPGTAGRAVAGVEVRIVADDQTVQPAGVDGEIVVRGPNVMAGYWSDIRAAGAGEACERGDHWWQDGWLRTGDIGHLDDESYLTIVDRKKDLIIRGGFNVYPRDIEEVLLEHPDVTAAGVVGRPDPRLGEEIVAFVTVRPGATTTATEVLKFGCEHMAPTKYPREIRVLSALPKTSVGKLNRRKLRDIVLAESGGEPGPEVR